MNTLYRTTGLFFLSLSIMKKHMKNEEGIYVIKNKYYDLLIGSRAQVFHGTAFKTAGGLTINDLIMNKNGRIVSLLKHKTAKREKRLVKAGYLTKKGKFGCVKKSGRKCSKKRL